MITFVGAAALLLPSEWSHWAFTFSHINPLVGWMAAFNQDTSLYFLWLLVFPVAWRMRIHLIDEHGSTTKAVEAWFQAGRYRADGQHIRGWKLAAALSFLIGVVGFVNTLQTGAILRELPPGFHDEYSYLFQAETFLQGRLTNPRFEAAPELFDQMHVLNAETDRFASRYFPGTGLWMTPFVAIGQPYLGHAVAQGLLCLFVFWIGRDSSGNGVGLLAGVLTALIPGLALFGNLLLAHHPCLVGIGLLMWMFPRWVTAGRPWQAILAGLGLSFAMSCRPMTAFAIGLPYGVWFLWHLWQHQSMMRQRGISIASMGGPVLLGLVMLLPYHAATTGQIFVSPYQQYTQLHTPRHVYGFYNRSRGEAWIAAREAAGQPLPVIEHYDEWATELTPARSFENLLNRLVASGQWTLGILPALAGVLFFFSIGHKDQPTWWAIGAALISLHLLHLPYWYDGIMHWHYVFETAPLIALMFARSTELIAWNARMRGRHWVTIWWLGLPAMGLLVAYTTVQPFWNSTLAAGTSEIQFAREKQAEFGSQVESLAKAPAVVFIKQDPADRHIDYVVNSPKLNAPILRARWLPDRYSVDELKKIFPGRNLYLVDLVEQQFVPLSP